MDGCLKKRGPRDRCSGHEMSSISCRDLRSTLGPAPRASEAVKLRQMSRIELRLSSAGTPDKARTGPGPRDKNSRVARQLSRAAPNVGLVAAKRNWRQLEMRLGSPGTARNSFRLEQGALAVEERGERRLRFTLALPR